MNIFEELGLEDSQELELKAKLGIELCTAIKELGESQASIAKRLRITQPKVSAILNMRLGGFSAERLAALLTRLDRNVELRVSRAKPAQQAAVSVVMVPVAKEFFIQWHRPVSPQPSRQPNWEALYGPRPSPAQHALQESSDFLYWTSPRRAS